MNVFGPLIGRGVPLTPVLLSDLIVLATTFGLAAWFVWFVVSSRKK